MDTLRRQQLCHYLVPKKRKLLFFGVIFALHVVLIFGPLVYFKIRNFFAPPPLNMFRVKIGGHELSHAPEVGMPERTRPTPQPPAPAPAEPKPQPEPKPEPKPQPKPEPKPKQKPKPKQQKTKPKPKEKAKTDSKSKTTDKKKTTPTKKPSKEELLQQDVYRPPAGGNNFNSNVPIGSHNRGQAFGKQDNRTPAGGATEEEERFGKNLGLYLKGKWTQPSKIHLGDTLPKTMIELSIAADGRVTDKRIVIPSGNAAMDASVQRMLDQLTVVPRPPRAATVQISIETE